MSDQTVGQNPFKDRRRWWVALLMLFPTGMGYIYVGRPWRFVGFTGFVFMCLAILYYGGWGWMNDQINFRVFMAIIIAAAIGFAADLITIALKQNTHDLRWPQRRKWYVASLMMWAALAISPDVTGTIADNMAVSLDKLTVEN